MKIEIARCNLAGGEKSFVGVVWPQFDHKRNETSWHPMKQNGIMHLKFNDTESRQYRIVHCVFERSTMGFKRPWVRFSPLGPKAPQTNLFVCGAFLFAHSVVRKWKKNAKYGTLEKCQDGIFVKNVEYLAGNCAFSPTKTAQTCWYWEKSFTNVYKRVTGWYTLWW